MEMGCPLWKARCSNGLKECLVFKSHICKTKLTQWPKVKFNSKKYVYSTATYKPFRKGNKYKKIVCSRPFGPLHSACQRIEEAELGNAKRKVPLFILGKGLAKAVEKQASQHTTSLAIRRNHLQEEYTRHYLYVNMIIAFCEDLPMSQ